MAPTAFARSVLSVALFLALLLLASDGGARTGDLNKDPADLVKQYVSLDNKGARLDSMSYEVLKPYTTWRDEPAWGHMVVIESYEVAYDIQQWELVSNLEVLIPVTYRTLGSVYWNTAVFIPDKQEEVVRFRVKAVNSRWKIVEPIMPPHVNQKRFLNHVREAALEETDPVRRQTLDSLASDLKKAK